MGVSLSTMTLAAETGACLLSVAADTLAVECLLEALGRVARRASDGLASFLQFAFIQDIFSVLVSMMAVFTGEAPFGMSVVGENHCRAVLLPEDLRRSEGHLVLLGFHQGDGNG